MTCMIHNHIQHTHMDLHGLYVEHACHIHKAAGQVSSMHFSKWPSFKINDCYASHKLHTNCTKYIFMWINIINYSITIQFTITFSYIVFLIGLLCQHIYNGSSGVHDPHPCLANFNKLRTFNQRWQKHLSLVHICGDNLALNCEILSSKEKN